MANKKKVTLDDHIEMAKDLVLCLHSLEVEAGKHPKSRPAARRLRSPINKLIKAKAALDNQLQRLRPPAELMNMYYQRGDQDLIAPEEVLSRLFKLREKSWKCFPVNSREVDIIDKAHGSLILAIR